jgi:hypothetical protein
MCTLITCTLARSVEDRSPFKQVRHYGMMISNEVGGHSIIKFELVIVSYGANQHQLERLDSALIENDIVVKVILVPTIG